MRTPTAPALALLALLATASPSHAEDPVCKNHYILRCEIPGAVAWLPIPSPLLQHGPGLTATTLEDGQVLVAGGEAAASGVEIFDPATASWRLAAPMTMPRANHRAVRLNDGRVLVVGGDRAPSAYGDPASAEIFDPRAGTWARTPALNVARHVWTRDLTATLLQDGTVLLTGGNTVKWDALASAEIYDPARGTWELTGSLARGRVGHAATLLSDGRVLVSGGVTDWDMWGQVGTAEVYDPGARSWRTLPGPATVNHTATLLADGRVLVAGGQTHVPIGGVRPGAIWPYGTIAHASFFDPAAERWSEAGALFTARHNHLAILLPNGDVLATGGRWDRSEVVYQYRTGVVADSEQLSVRNGGWRQVEQLGNPPESADSATLHDGSVLVVGGTAALLTYTTPKRVAPRFSR